MTPHSHHHPGSHAHGHHHAPHSGPAPVPVARASWLLHSAAWRGLWAALVCAGVVLALAWAMAGQG